eukprot:m.223307 g.223307  ORF g.223307 m.223307 type:complete len:383 (+) comp16228_c0_seq1:269-1417(+)
MGVGVLVVAAVQVVLNGIVAAALHHPQQHITAGLGHAPRTCHSLHVAPRVERITVAAQPAVLDTGVGEDGIKHGQRALAVHLTRNVGRDRLDLGVRALDAAILQGPDLRCTCLQRTGLDPRELTANHQHHLATHIHLAQTLAHLVGVKSAIRAAQLALARLGNHGVNLLLGPLALHGITPRVAILVMPGFAHFDCTMLAKIVNENLRGVLGRGPLAIRSRGINLLVHPDTHTVHMLAGKVEEHARLAHDGGIANFRATLEKSLAAAAIVLIRSVVVQTDTRHVDITQVTVWLGWALHGGSWVLGVTPALTQKIASRNLIKGLNRSRRSLVLHKNKGKHKHQSHPKQKRLEVARHCSVGRVCWKNGVSWISQALHDTRDSRRV